ncbi:MAG: hypothetical protein HQM10_09045 [Candidatus Riflebacteria bacterium]|nr:hypothetical protein [Candidatus Riflebacteria bacterium]
MRRIKSILLILFVVFLPTSVFPGSQDFLASLKDMEAFSFEAFDRMNDCFKAVIQKESVVSLAKGLNQTMNKLELKTDETISIIKITFPDSSNRQEIEKQTRAVLADARNMRVSFIKSVDMYIKRSDQTIRAKIAITYRQMREKTIKTISERISWLSKQNSTSIRENVLIAEEKKD